MRRREMSSCFRNAPLTGNGSDEAKPTLLTVSDIDLPLT
jgi:hypothetical protein